MIPLAHLDKYVARLVCPQTKLPLRLCPAEEAAAHLQSRLLPRRVTRNARGQIAKPFGVTEWVLLRQDLRCAYPVVNGYPILLAPEMLTPAGQPQSFDLCDPRYAEAYEEMEIYNAIAAQEAQEVTRSEAYRDIKRLLPISAAQRATFPSPRKTWIETVYDCAAQWDAYQHIAPIQGKRLMQLGGKGTHAVKLLLAGAAESWVVTPMLGEATYAQALAEAVGVADRLRCVVAIGEELPLKSETFDAIYSGGCLHHMETTHVLPEVARVLHKNGKFAAAELWHTPLYSWGIKIFGKREANVYCRPLDETRMAPFGHTFPNSQIIHHGALFRYAMLALHQVGLPTSSRAAWALSRMDDLLASPIKPLRKRFGGSVAILGTK